jgi:hypothetical protein
MKSAILCGLLASVIGIGLGSWLGYREARMPARAVQQQPSPSSESGDEPASQDTPIKQAVADVAEPTFRFGKMERGTSMRHDFQIHNHGTAPLSVSFLSHTCKCTLVQLNGKAVAEGDGDSIEPSGEGIVTLEWVAKTPAGPFRHGATFATNDPKQSRIEFTVEGDVVESSTLYPPNIYFNSVREGETREEQVTVLSYLEPEVQILSHELSLPDELQRRVQVRVESLEADQLPDPEAEAGARVTLVLDAGGTLGPFYGNLELVTNLAKAQKLTVPVSGVIKGDISVYGRGWRGEAGLLKLGAVASAEGAQVPLNVMVRGEHAANIEMTVQSVSPPALRATLGVPQERNDRLVQIPLTVEIPKGTRPMVHVGEDQGGEGEIVLHTNHPTTPEFKLRVQFAVRP